MNPFEEINKRFDDLEKLLRAREPEDVLTTDQVARLLKVDRRTVYQYRDQGLLTARGIGKLTRYKRSEVLAALVQISGKEAA